MELLFLSSRWLCESKLVPPLPTLWLPVSSSDLPICMVLPQDAVHQDAMETRRPSPGAKQMGLLNRRLSQTGFLKIMIKYPAWETGHAVVR